MNYKHLKTIPSFSASDTMPKAKDYSKDIIQIDDGMIGIPITRENMHDTAAIWAALKAAPTPKKKG